METTKVQTKTLRASTFWLSSILLGMLLSSSDALAANKVWRGTVDTSWKNGANWDVGTKPGAADVAVFDVTATKDCLMDENVNVAGIDIQAAFVRNITQGTGITITVGASSFLQAGGTFLGGNATIRINNPSIRISGGSFRSTSGNLDIANASLIRTAGTFDANGGTTRFISNQNIVDLNDASLFNVIVSHGNPMSYMRFDSDLTVQGKFTLLSGSLSSPSGGGTATVSLEGDVETRYLYSNPQKIIFKFTGGNAQQVTANGGSGAIPSVEIAKTAGTTVTFNDNIYCRAGDGVPLWLYTSGNAVWAPGSKFVDYGYNTPFTDSQTIFNDVEIRKANGITTLTVTGTWHVAGDFKITSSGRINGGTIEVGGDLISTTNTVGGTTLMVLNGTGDQNITVGTNQLTAGTLTIHKTLGTALLTKALPLTFTNQDLVVTDGTLDLKGFTLNVNDKITVQNGGRIRALGSETVTGTKDFKAGSEIEYYGTGSYTTKLPFGNAYVNLFFTGVGGLWEPDGPVTVSENLTITAGTFDIDGNNLTVTGTFSNDGKLRMEGTEVVSMAGDADSGIVEYDGEGDGNPGSVSLKDIAYFDLLVNLTDAVDTLSSSMGSKVVNGTLIVARGIFVPPASFTVSGLVSVSGGTHQSFNATQAFGGLSVSAGDMDAGTSPLQINGDVTLSGGTFTASSATTTVTGNWSNGATFNANNGSVVFENAASSTFSGSSTFNAFTCLIPGKNLIFAAGSTQTILGTLTLNGQAAGTLIQLRSSAPGSPWNLSPQGPRDISFVRVQDGVNLVLPIINPPDSVNGGNTVWWFDAIDSNPVATPSIVALGNPFSLSSAPTGGSGIFTSFFWTGPGGFTSTAQNPGLVTAQSVGIEVYTLTVTDTWGLTNTSTVDVAVIESALKPNASADPILVPVGGSTNLFSQPTGGTGIYLSYHWTGPDGFSSSLQNPGVVTPQNVGVQTYTLTVVDGSGLVETESVVVLVGVPGVILNSKSLKYKVMSASRAEKPLDRLKVVLLGVDLLPGDRLFLNFNGHWVGRLGRGDGLTLDQKLRAKGQLGTSPYLWHKCRAKFTPKRRMLTFVASRGNLDSGGAPMVMAASGISPTTWVSVVVDRAPADGVPDVAFMAPVVMNVKVRATAAGATIETGRAYKNPRK